MRLLVIEDHAPPREGLCLSCLAALQAPVIMMSQNRVEARDRERAEQDYQINLKAELEIRHLHEKLDHLPHQHGERLLEIQTIQTELLRQLVERRDEGVPSRPTRGDSVEGSAS
jgi:uncharacterized membrane protein